jgi:FGGY-family pentulose kinase
MVNFTKPFVVGIDAGTGGVRAGVFDSTGRPVIFLSKECPTSFARPGWAEQDPEDWWNALKSVVREAVGRSMVDVSEIAAIGVDGTSSTLVCADGRGSCIRNAILWMDNRSSEQAGRIFETGHPVLRRTQAGVSAEWMIPKILWLLENEPGNFEKTVLFMEQVDWINFKLTGEFALSVNHITHRWFYNRREGGWPNDFYETIGLRGITGKFPRRILNLGEVVGTLTAQAACELGLREGTLVAEGGCDAYVGTLGLNVVRPGRAALITGSSHLVLPVTEDDFYIKGVFGTHPDCVIPGLNVMEGGQVSTGSIVKWFKDNFTTKEELEADRLGISHYAVLNKKASEVPIGSEGLVVLDFWQGNRNPYTDYLLTGAIWGLTLKHQSGHIFRAIMEGVAYGTENILRTLSENGLKTSELFVGGGAASSELWVKIHADVSNLPIHIPVFTEATILGSAICAAVGAGIYENLVDAAGSMVHISKTIEPERENHLEYEYYFDKYKETYVNLKGLMHDMAEKCRIRRKIDGKEDGHGNSGKA